MAYTSTSPVLAGYEFTSENMDYYIGWLTSLQESYTSKGTIKIMRYNVRATMNEIVTVSGTLKLTAKSTQDADKIMVELQHDVANGVVMLTSIGIQYEGSADQFIDFEGYLTKWDDKLTAQDFKEDPK